MIKGRPPRLELIFPSYDSPVFFVTFCTLHQIKIERLDIVHDAFKKYANRARDEFNVAVGRYVIMPDHVHFVCSGWSDFPS